MKDERLYAQISLDMDEHPKVVGLSDAAFRAMIEALLYSRRRLTDGFLDERLVVRRWGQEVADELSSNDPHRPSWSRLANGWQIHDFEKHQTTSQKIDDLLEKRKRAGQMGGFAKAAKQNASKRLASGKQTSSKSYPETETETETKKEQRVRASRIPLDFTISDDMRAWAKREVPLVDVDKKLPEFIDFWLGVPGERGLKSDWVSTWRNGMRKQQQFAEKDRPKVAVDWMNR